MGMVVVVGGGGVTSCSSVEADAVGLLPARRGLRSMPSRWPIPAVSCTFGANRIGAIDEADAGVTGLCQDDSLDCYGSTSSKWARGQCAHRRLRFRPSSDLSLFFCRCDRDRSVAPSLRNSSFSRACAAAAPLIPQHGVWLVCKRECEKTTAISDEHLSYPINPCSSKPLSGPA